MSLQIINRRGYLNEWTQAEGQGKGNLRRGEIAIAIVTDDNTPTGDIVEVIGRIGPSDTPTPFSDCPVVFRSPRGFKGADVRPVLVDEDPKVDSVLAFDSTNGKFVSLNEDPGTYEEDDDDDDDDGGELSEVAPTILSAQVKNLDSQAVVGTNPKYDLEVKVVGRPDPILSIEIIETAWPDFDGNALNFTTTTSYNFTSDNLPSGVLLSVEDDPALAALGVRTYTFGRVVVNRDVPMSRVSLNAKIGASNPAGSAPAVERALQGSIEFIEDPATAAADPKLTKVSISEGGSEKSKIANLATDASTTLAASYVADNFTDGVANGTVSYQWSSNGSVLVGETGSTLTLTNTADAYNDSQIKVDVTITDDNGTDTRSGYLAVGDYDEGFTELSPSADSRLIYIATDGDDAQAASNQHGRPYYLPSDPEIGPDPLNPVGPIRAFADPFLAVKYVRGAQYSGDRPDGFPDYDTSLPRTTGYPDWVLFRRGQTFTTTTTYTSLYSGNQDTIDWGAFVGTWSQSKGPVHGHGAEENNTGGPRGRSESEPMVVTAWGPLSDPRPVFSDSIQVKGSHRVVASIQAPGLGFGFLGEVSWINTDGEQTGLLVEDCKFTRGMGGTNQALYKNARFRRCVVVDSFNPGGHNQGLFLKDPYNRADSKEIGWDLVIEECVWDRNGYKEDPNEPTTWTIGFNADVPYGTGVQPRRTYYDRNLYMSSYTDLKVRGNIISRGGGGSGLQMRVGGVCERNLFLMNAQCVGMGHPQATPAYFDDGLIVDNVFLHDEHFIPPGGHSTAVDTNWFGRDLVVTGNIVARFMRSTGTTAVITFQGNTYNSDKTPAHPAKMIAMFDNDIDLDGGKHPVEIKNSGGTDILDAVFRNNRIWKGAQLDTNSNFRIHTTISGFFDPSGNTSDEPWDWDGNHFSSATLPLTFRIASDQGVTLAEWQAAGFDQNSTVYQDRSALAAAAGWTDPDRSILTYMQAVDPTYTVDEDVYVDDGSSGQKQAVRQKVWEVIAPNFGEATAKQIARNYHAFLAFIEKARNNRKGAWDSRWTADAVNNYIREGYGKPARGGAYTADLSSVPTRLAEVSA